VTRLPRRLLVIVPAIAALVLLSGYAAQLGAAATKVREANDEMDRWTALNAQPAPDELETVASMLADAWEMAPRNPAANELLGVLEMQQGKSPESLHHAGVHLSTALAVRPTSPYTWANLAALGYRMGQDQRQLEAALVGASQMGPHEAEVQQTVAFIGLAVWDEISPDTRRAVEAMVAAGMNRKPLEMLRISQRRGRLEVACRHFNSSMHQTELKSAQICQSLEATP
jgi:hypothetical protein